VLYIAWELWTLLSNVVRALEAGVFGFSKAGLSNSSLRFEMTRLFCASRWPAWRKVVPQPHLHMSSIDPPSSALYRQKQLRQAGAGVAEGAATGKTLQW